MKGFRFKKAVPHLLAAGVFLIVTLLFCKPVLEGKVLNQHDIVSWKGMVQGSLEYKERNGRLPLWNTNLFSGMPNYQVGMEGKNFLPDLNKVLSLGLPKPMNYFFLACLWFYFLCLAVGARPAVAMFAALFFSFATYTPVIISAGHETKMLAMIYMPAVLCGLLLIYQKKYWPGLAVAAYAAFNEIGANHIQITFYLVLLVIAITIPYVIKWIKEKDWKHLITAGSLSVVAGIIGMAGSALLLMTNYEYAKATMRGGSSVEIKNDSVINKKTSGLSKDYAFQYSLGKMETSVLLMPEAFGGSSRKTFDEGSKVVKALVDKGMSEGQAAQIASGIPKYWGGIDGAGTSGPPYLGAIVCLFAIIGFVFIKHPLRWGLLAASIFAICISWGKYFYGFNAFLFDTIPLYNKFRAPSMSLVITQVAFPLMAALCLEKLLSASYTPQQFKPIFKKLLYVIGALIAFLGLAYLMMDYSSWIDAEILKNKDENGDNAIARAIVSGMKAERRAMFGGQLLRTILYAGLVIGAVYLFLSKKMKPVYTLVIIASIAFIDLFIVGKRYLGDEYYVEKDEYTSQNFTPDQADQDILRDKDPQFRVLNLSPDRFMDAQTSYFHRSIGGYHPAKLQSYQDVITQYLSDRTNPEVINMLNGRYVIIRNEQTGQRRAQRNESAYGAAWFIKNVVFTSGSAEELSRIGTIQNLKDTACIDVSFKNLVSADSYSPDSLSVITLVKYDNDFMEYKTKTTSPQLAVLSEIYYPLGWNAYIDNKKTPYLRADYILRAIPVPSGEHTIQFRFEPESYTRGNKISYAVSIILPVLLLLCAFQTWRTEKKKAKGA